MMRAPVRATTPDGLSAGRVIVRSAIRSPCLSGAASLLVRVALSWPATARANSSTISARYNAGPSVQVSVSASVQLGKSPPASDARRIGSAFIFNESSSCPARRQGRCVHVVVLAKRQPACVGRDFHSRRIVRLRVHLPVLAVQIHADEFVRGFAFPSRAARLRCSTRARPRRRSADCGPCR